MQFDLGVSVIWFIAFLMSTTVHEAMHAWVAWKGGDPTAYLGGQVSLSPVPHVRREPIGMLVVPLLTAFTQGWVMGWASAPYDPYWAARHPRRAALMAAAGPAGNLAIALVAFLALKAGLAFGYYVAPAQVSFSALVALESGGIDFAGACLSVFLVLNVFLGVFNLLPVPPLDGSTVLGAVLPESLAAPARALQANPAMSMLGLLVAWRVFPLLTDRLFALVLTLVHPEASYS